MAKRTDKFSPSKIDPSKFVFVANHYLGHSEEAWEALCNEMADEQENLEAHQAEHPCHTTANHKWEGHCDCCGARYLYGATFYTAEDNTYIRVGSTCASKLGLGSPVAMKRFRDQINTWKIHQERVVKARTYLTSINLTSMLDLYLTPGVTNIRDGLTVRDLYPERTLVDMCSKVVQWGNELSANQQKFAHSLLAQIIDRPRLLAERAAADVHRQPVPANDKRLTIRGKVLSTKVQEGFAGDVLKMLVEHADGWKVWGTVPTDMIRDAEELVNKGYMPLEEAGAVLKGRTVEFDAKIQRSDKDPKFGFFSRPTKAIIITEEVVA